MHINLNLFLFRNLDIIFNLQDKGMVIENTFTWFEKEFHRIPTELIENNKLYLDKLVINNKSISNKILLSQLNKRC